MLFYRMECYLQKKIKLKKKIYQKKDLSKKGLRLVSRDPLYEGQFKLPRSIYSNL
jgi:hypothetical protein